MKTLKTAGARTIALPLPASRRSFSWESEVVFIVIARCRAG